MVPIVYQYNIIYCWHFFSPLYISGVIVFLISWLSNYRKGRELILFAYGYKHY